MSIVKLYIYNHQPEKTYIDIVEANDFGDFLLVVIDSNLNPEDVENMRMSMSKVTDKKIIFIPKGLDIEFYGVEKASEEND